MGSRTQNTSAAPTAIPRAILDAPDDDAPRLVFADALQERTDPRGELISIQCALAALGLDGERIHREWIGDDLADDDALEDGSIAKLRAREAKLLDAHGDVWSNDAAHHAVADGLRFRRGFVEHVRWDARKRLAKDVDALFDAVPLLRALDFATSLAGNPVEDLRAFLASPHLARLRELYPSTEAGPLLRDARTLTGLRRLTLGGVGEESARAIVEAPFTGQLSGLVLCSIGGASHLGDVLAAAGSLAELQLVDATIPAPAATKLVATKAAADVAILSLRATRLGAGGAGAVLASRAWPALVALDLRKNKLGVVDARAVAALPRIRVLDVGGNPLRDDGVAALLATEAPLRTLRLESAGLGDAAAKAIAKAPIAASLRALDLRKNAITDDGAKVLGAAKSLKTLRTLHLGGNRLTAEGKKALKAALPATRCFL